jgi:hypothetical protein
MSTVTQRGALYVAYGKPARREALASIGTLKQRHPELPIVVVSDSPLPGSGACHVYAADVDPGARWAKLNLDRLAPPQWQYILYIDADTRVWGDLTPGFQILQDGWDLALTFSDNQRDSGLGTQDLLWHLGEEERATTLDELGNPFPLQYQCGVLFVNRNVTTARLFVAWREEWQRWRDKDQSAFMRALHRVPVRIWLLGRCWNGTGSEGAIVGHRFGQAARMRR